MGSSGQQAGVQHGAMIASAIGLADGIERTFSQLAPRWARCRPSRLKVSVSRDDNSYHRPAAVCWGDSCTATPVSSAIPGAAVQLPPQQGFAGSPGPRKLPKISPSILPHHRLGGTVHCHSNDGPPKITQGYLESLRRSFLTFSPTRRLPCQDRPPWFSCFCWPGELPIGATEAAGGRHQGGRPVPPTFKRRSIRPTTATPCNCPPARALRPRA